MGQGLFGRPSNTKKLAPGGGGRKGPASGAALTDSATRSTNALVATRDAGVLDETRETGRFTTGSVAWRTSSYDGTVDGMRKAIPRPHNARAHAVCESPTSTTISRSR
jgi:hypothetical protein